MVRGNLAYKYHEEEQEQEIDYTYLPDPLKYTSVSLQEVIENKLRLEASAFNLEAKAAKDKILANRHGYVNLWSENGLVETAFHKPRFKRVYVERKEIPFFQPSTITEVYPKPSKFISAKTKTDLNDLKVKKGMLLMTVSGTIGKVAIVGNKLNDQIFSHDLLRLIGKGKYDTGYIYAYFLTEIGQQILQSNNYGAVIQHIEPEHLQSIIIPNAPEVLKKEIHELVIASYDLRDQSNDLLDQAEKILYKELQLKPIEELEIEYFDNAVDLRNYTTKLENLNLRLDCSYHLPIVKLIENEIKRNAKEISTVGKLSKKVILAGVFKRTYVDKENGVPFLGGRDITQLNPQTEKYLSKTIHASRIKKELEVFENYVLVSDRGTIGKTQIVPRHWNSWAVSQNIIKVVTCNNIAGYLYCFLNSDYGQILIKRETYGSVVDMIDNANVSNICIPLLKDQSKQQKINDLVLEANEIRYQAHMKEQEAIQKMEKLISSINRFKPIK